jgi:hypothetical protein
MKKIFEIDINEDFKRAIISQYFLMIFTFLLSIVIHTHEKSIINFGFLVEIVLLGLGFKFYFTAQKNRNYAYWGITFLIAGFLIMNVLHYTFVDYDIFILYISFLAGIFLAINSYVMSSPLFYPRVQWWEYDFRFRGDLKTQVETKNKSLEGRLTDLRRGCGSFDIFSYIALDSNVVLKVSIDEKTYLLSGQVKTIKQVTPGRPIRYGVKIDLSDDEVKSTYLDIKKIWDENKKAKLSNKFSESTEK